ncbi:piggyBac transposable element-derived protein 3 [Trichonephila clavipes]|nr:piggyBac transposable element-derived protein 3 [Trichonephila clavipes]
MSTVPFSEKQPSESYFLAKEFNVAHVVGFVTSACFCSVFGTLGKTTTTKTYIFSLHSFFFFVELIFQVRKTLHELTNLLETDDNIEASAIIIQPPENATVPVSNEHSGEEDGRKIENLPGSLLHALAYLVLDDSFYNDSDPDDPPHFPKFDSPADGVASTSTNAQQSPLMKKRKSTKVVHK